MPCRIFLRYRFSVIDNTVWRSKNYVQVFFLLHLHSICNNVFKKKNDLSNYLVAIQLDFRWSKRTRSPTKSLFQGHRFGSYACHLPQDGVADHWRNMDIVNCGSHADILRLCRPPRADDVTRCRQHHCGVGTFVMHAQVRRI